MNDEAMNVDQHEILKSQTLQAVTTGPLSYVLSDLSASSRAIPSDKDFHYYYNFEEFKLPLREISEKSQSLLESIGASSHIWGKDMGFPDDSVDEDATYDWLVNVNDEVYERFDVSIDEFQKIRKKEEEIGRSLGAAEVEDAESGGFQLVYGKKKKKGLVVPVNGGNSGNVKEETGSAVKRVNVGGKAKVPFHIATIKRPQDEYNILVDNSNQPFPHVWLQRSEDGETLIHPLENLSFLDFVDKNVQDVEPVKPPTMESTPFTFVEDVKHLKELAAKLRGVNEFAVDLEHNQYRSFQGLTCLMQISTRTEDFIVDTLKLRIYIGPHLREVFKDPTKKKVMHGADRDIVWLQRDFGIYVCNLFDTGQASRVLKLERNSLEYLLQHYCGVTANKEYQNADWRLRPLPEEMVRYAREDTHYLLYMYDLMRINLFQMPVSTDNSDNPLVEVYKRSYDICMQLYEKELLTENSYLHVYGLAEAGFTAQQLAVVAGLCEWRDVVARTEDESTGYILPNKILLETAKHMPLTAGKLRRLLKYKHPYLERNLAAVVSIIRNSMHNADAFEAAVQQLREGRSLVEMAQHEDIEVNDACEVISPDSLTSIATDNTVITLQSASQELPMTSSKLESSFPENGKGMINGSYTLGKSGDANTYGDRATSAQVSAATVQVLKKPNRAFGALLGNATTKRKFDSDPKDKIKLEQIKASVNLSFFSFPNATTEPSKPVTEVPSKTSEISPPRENADVETSCPVAEEMITLEDDSDFDGLTNPDSDPTEKVEEKLNNNDEPMSLSDLSSSLEKCVDSSNKAKRPDKVKKLEEQNVGLEFEPFDYATARKEVIFGEQSTKANSSDQKKLLKSGGKKKTSKIGEIEETTEFPQGRRRHAFPASGNRSGHFRK